MNRIILIIGVLLFIISCNAPLEFPLPSFFQGSKYPNMIKSNDGSLFILWTSESDTTSSVIFSEFMQNKWTEPSIIFSSNSLMVNWADFPSIFKSNGDTLFAHCLEKSSAETFDYHILLSYSIDRGKSWSTPLKVNRDQKNKGEHGFLSFYPSKNGVGIAWLDGRHMGEYNMETHTMGDMALYQSSFSQGILTAEKVLDQRVCECCPTDAVAIPGGTLIAYRDRSEKEIRNINVIRIIDGIAQNPITVHEDNWFIPGCPVNGPKIAEKNGKLAIAWFTAPNGEAQVNVSFSNDLGKTFSDPIRVDGGKPQGRVDLEWVNNETLMVNWLEAKDEMSSIVYRKIKNDGKLSDLSVVATLEGGRGIGYPQMELLHNQILFVWTDPLQNKIQSKWIKND
ncbi:MAG: hypothetical protein HN462_06410 [Candidatus Marinimicrobia bacterium]|jgi:hypothetical protein|nr:hypothetical protein [Candidatus Neomarinimicrobiota bacterium]MBT3496808.1 hypothetical protein [Candidatus Neomarinimicrobiota bacterium]MBT6158773.1 hypothetical protein [Candidatus Neomarinimicrobiota bacterium]MBT7358374.1 hypothetical protein [Candidatus Neomarinimicrobiota bacterium]